MVFHWCLYNILTYRPTVTIFQNLACDMKITFCRGTIVQPTLEYGSPAWDLYYEKDIQKLEKVPKGYRMVNPRLCGTVRPLFKNPRPNYKSSGLRDCSTYSEPEIPRLLFRMPRFRDWADIFRDALLSHRPFYIPFRDRQRDFAQATTTRMPV